MNTQTSKKSIFDRAIDPVIQAGMILGVVLVFNIIAKFLAATGLMNVSERFPWMTAAAFLLFFAVFNSLYLLTAKSMVKYWGRSIYSFMGLAAASGIIAYLFSSLTISEAGSYRWIYIVVTLGYLVFISIMIFLRRIVEFAQKEEWNHPRIRRRKRK
ncbi:MAG: hypothetical protein R2824_17465 [Saprospiraceae bacterium]